MSIITSTDENFSFADLLAESEIFEISREYINMIKEATEIELMERFCACQEFITENADINDGMKSMLLTEAVDDATISDVSAKMEKKKSGLWSKIAAGAKRLINALVSLFGRLFNFWNNGKELDKLRAEAKELKDLNAEQLATAAKNINDIRRGKQHAIDNLRDKVSQKDAEIAQLKIVSAQKDSDIARINAKFKGVDADLYRWLQDVETSIADTIVVDMPQAVSEIDNFTKEVGSAIDSYKVIRGKVGGNKNLHVKHARNISELLKKLKASRNKMVRTTINPAWIHEVYQSLQSDKDKIAASIGDINASFNAAHDTKDNTGTTKNAAVHGVRASADANFMELQRNLVGLLNEWMYLANGSIKTIKELMEIRNRNLKVQSQILNEIRKAA